MLPLDLMFLSALALTVLSGAAATWLVIADRRTCISRRKVAERLAKIALLGATAIFALLQNIAR